MELGIFAKTFVRPDFEDAFAAARNCGLSCIQFNFSCAGMPTLPESIEPVLLDRIRSARERHSLSMAAVSGTCNLINPDSARRTKDLTSLQTLIAACPGLGTSIVTLCTGTRDPADMWRAHPDNHSPRAWRDLVLSLQQLLPIAQARRVFLGIEPESANVIDSASKARKLLDEIKSPWLKVIFDAANLLQPEALHQQHKILSGAVDLVGADIVLAHAKDLTEDHSARHVAAGQGALDYGLYLALLQQAAFNGPLILHNLREKEVPRAVSFVQEKMRSLQIEHKCKWVCPERTN
jgi:sugar phosphate isomerase/epimerase